MKLQDNDSYTHIREPFQYKTSSYWEYAQRLYVRRLQVWYTLQQQSSNIRKTLALSIKYENENVFYCLIITVALFYIYFSET